MFVTQAEMDLVDDPNHLADPCDSLMLFEIEDEDMSPSPISYMDPPTITSTSLRPATSPRETDESGNTDRLPHRACARRSMKSPRPSRLAGNAFSRRFSPSHRDLMAPPGSAGVINVGYQVGSNRRADIDTQPIRDDGSSYRRLSDCLGHTGEVLQYASFLTGSQGRNNYSGVGTLARLPLEIRFAIYNYAVDHDFKQHYMLHDYSIELLASSSKLPPILHASKHTCEETMQAIQNGRSCEITIADGLIATNFMLFDYLRESPFGIPDLCSDMLHIPSCKELVIGLQIPCPRSSNGMASARKTVQQIVTLINCLGQPLPRLRITFETNEYHAQQVFVHNDFAMLAGPLYKLQHAAQNGMVIDRCVRWDSQADTKRHHICRMIEAAVRGFPPQELVTQQLLIDVKLAINRHLSDGESRRQPYSATGCKKLVDLLSQLTSSCNAQGEVPPLWVSEASELMSAGAVPYDTLDTYVKKWFGGSWMAQATSWASGHFTARNPFYREDAIKDLSGGEKGAGATTSMMPN